MAANAEAALYLTRALDLLQALPETPERAHEELLLLITLTAALTATQGYGSPALSPALTRRGFSCCRWMAARVEAKLTREFRVGRQSLHRPPSGFHPDDG